MSGAAGVPEFVWWLISFVGLVLAIGAALWLFSLRPEAPVWKKQLEKALQEQNSKQRDLANLARLLPEDLGEPYTSLRARGKREFDVGSGALDSVRQMLKGVDPEAIQQLPNWSLWLVLPTFYELGQRLWLAWRLDRASQQLQLAEESLKSLQRVLNEVERQGREVTRLVNHARDEARMLHQRAQALNGTGALNELIGQLSEALLLLDKASGLLQGMQDDEQKIVVKAFAELKQAEGKISSVAERLRVFEKNREKFAPQLKQLQQTLAEMDEALKDEETHYACPTFRQEWGEMKQALDAVLEAFEAGRFQQVETGLAEQQKAFKDWQTRLARLQQERGRLEQLYTETDEQLNALRSWLKELPADYQMDVSQDHMQLLEKQLQRVMQTLRSDRVEEYRKFEVFKLEQVKQVQLQFEQRLQNYERLMANGHSEHVNALVQRAEGALQELSERHERYRTRSEGKLLQDALTNLQQTLALAQTNGMVVVQSRLEETIGLWRNLQDAMQALTRRCEAVEKVLGQVKVEAERAQKLLNDPIFKQCDVVIANGLSEQVALGQNIVEGINRLREQISKPNGDFGAVAVMAEKLRSDAQRLSDGYQADLRKNQGRLLALQEDLRTVRAALKNLREHGFLYFSQLANSEDPIVEWMADADRVSRDSLRAVVRVVQTGEELYTDAKAKSDAAQADVKRVDAKLEEANGALRRAEEALQEARAAQQRSPWLQNGLDALGLFDSDEAMLQNVRETLGRVSRPFRKRLVMEVLDDLERALTSCQTVQGHAKQVMQEIRRQAQQMTDSENKPAV